LGKIKYKKLLKIYKNMTSNESHSEIINNLYVLFDKSDLNSFTSVYKFTDEFGEAKFISTQKLTEIDILVDDVIIINIPSFTIDLKGYEVVIFLLYEYINGQLTVIETYDDFNKYLHPLILQMDEQGQINILQTPKQITKPNTTYRVMYSIRLNKIPSFSEPFILDDINRNIVNLKQYPEGYNKILNSFNEDYKFKDITVDSLLTLQNTNLKLLNIPHIDINILVNFDYKFITYLAQFSPYLLNLIDTENFYMEYIIAHYGRNILNEKDLNSDRKEKLSYKQWFNYLIRNDTIFFKIEINRIIQQGKYYLTKHIFEKHTQKNYMYDMFLYYIGKSENINMVNILDNIDENWELINEVLVGASQTNPEWFEELINKFNVDFNEINIPYFIHGTFIANNLTMVKHLINKYKATFDEYTDEGNIYGLLYGLIEVFTFNIKQIKKDSLEHEKDENYISSTLKLLKYVFIESEKLNINYFRNTSQRLINNGVDINDENNENIYLRSITELTRYLGESGDDKLVSFFLNDLNIMVNFNNFVKVSLYIILLHSIAGSGNVTLFKKYFNIVKEILSEEIIIQNNLDLQDSNETNLLKLIDPKAAIDSGNIEMVKHFDSLDLFDGRMYEKIVRPKMIIEGPDVVNIIVYALNSENMEIFNYLNDKFADTEYFVSNIFQRDILETGSGLGDNNNNVYDPLLFTLYLRGIINLYDIIAFDPYQDYPEDNIVELIWIFRMPSSDFISFLKIIDNRWYPHLMRTLNRLIELHYITEDDIQFTLVVPVIENLQDEINV